MAVDDHGSCVHCGSDLNGERVYDYFLKKYDGNEVDALATASMYGCKKGWGRFGRAILCINYSKELKRKYYKCPDCGKECYGRKD